MTDTLLLKPGTKTTNSPPLPAASYPCQGALQGNNGDEPSLTHVAAATALTGGSERPHHPGARCRTMCKGTVRPKPTCRARFPYPGSHTQCGLLGCWGCLAASLLWRRLVHRSFPCSKGIQVKSALVWRFFAGCSTSPQDMQSIKLWCDQLMPPELLILGGPPRSTRGAPQHSALRCP